MALVSVSRQAMVHLDGSRYSVPSHWKSLEATAWLGVEDVRLVCRGEDVVLDRIRRGGRHVQYRHYLSELAKKPQAVRQVAPELVAELGEPYGRLWQLLGKRYGAREGARGPSSSPCPDRWAGRSTMRRNTPILPCRPGNRPPIG